MLKQDVTRRCYIAGSLREELAMQNHNDAFSTALSLNEYLVKAAVEYWTAMSYPALFFAKYL
jgi:hypothetical protein